MAAPRRLVRLLEERLGHGSSLPRLDLARYAAPPPAALPDLGVELSVAARARLAHARGRGFTDLLRLRTATLPRLPDAVVFASGERDVASVLDAAAREQLTVIPWGGGTSVTGGVNAPTEGAATIVLDLARLSGLRALDATSGLATFGAGTTGPAIEAALAPHGLTLGHFPQSFELSTLGGWIVTRSSGQESLAYGGIERMVAGVQVVAPAGRLTLPATPASAAGPDLRQLILGSEGRLGVVTEATVRTVSIAAARRAEGALLPSFDHGLEAVRELVRRQVPLAMVRLSDAAETEIALAVGIGGGLKGLVSRGYLRLRGLATASCLLLFAAHGSERQVAATAARTRRDLKRQGAVKLGEAPARGWLRDRFRHPYLRDALLDVGLATDTLETAAPWSVLPRLYQAVRAALEIADHGEQPPPVLCHLSHPYVDGASLYFTWFFRLDADIDQTIVRWAAAKRRATEAILESGGTLSHHHGVGAWHAPYLPREIGPLGRGVLDAVAKHLDPCGVLNPHVLVADLDRLEA